MLLLRTIAAGLRSLFRRETVTRELDEEMGEFLDMAAQEKMQQGMSRDDALREVRLERGSLEIAREAVGSAGWESVVEACWQDIRAPHAAPASRFHYRGCYDTRAWHWSQHRNL